MKSKERYIDFALYNEDGREFILRKENGYEVEYCATYTIYSDYLIIVII